MRRAVTLAVFAAISSLVGLTPALAAGFSVPLDEVRVISFKSPVSTIYIGNSVIADATLIDSKHAFLLGKTMGQTNLLALGTDGKVISNDQITIFGRRMGMVTLNKGSVQFTFTCTSQHCESQPIPGDEPTTLGTTNAAIQQHEDMANKAGTGGSVASSGPAQ